MTATAARGGPTTPVALLSLTAVATLAAATGLLLWTLVPLLFGWSSSVVVSGSMSPAVEPGDVVVTSPVQPEQVKPGYVVRFENPSRPGQSLLHRIARVDENGLLVTKGDANASEDSTPVPPYAVDGMARLRVPWIGLPMLWYLEREYLKVLVFLTVLAGMCSLVPVGWGWTGPPPKEPLDEGPAGEDAPAAEGEPEIEGQPAAEGEPEFEDEPEIEDVEDEPDEEPTDGVEHHTPTVPEQALRQRPRRPKGSRRR